MVNNRLLISSLLWVFSRGYTPAVVNQETMSTKTPMTATRSVRLPLHKAFSIETENQLKMAFGAMMDSLKFLEEEQKVKHHFHSLQDTAAALGTSAGVAAAQQVCRIPAFGPDVRMSFGPEFANDGHKVQAYVLTVEGMNQQLDFGWLCSQLYEQKQAFNTLLDFETDLRLKVARFHNNLSPHPGNLATPICTNQIKDLFQQHDQRTGTSWMELLSEQGFVILENGPKTTVEQHQKLSQYLKQNTRQSENVRTDTVHFLKVDEAVQTGLDNHFNLLLGMADHLNNNQAHILDSTDYQPIPPATKERPLTVPGEIQLAEYGLDDFYIAHSDNSWTNGYDSSNTDSGAVIRRNFRQWTCILYCNDDWTTEMGGALRIYRDSFSQATPSQAVQECDYVDVYPENGRMILFDSRMVHAVLKNKSMTPRRALTIWINRPNDSGVQGEVYY